MSEPVPVTPYPAGRVITLSRQLGSGGRKVADVAEQAGQWLHWQVWDTRILDAIASQSSRRLQARAFEALDEKGRAHSGGHCEQGAQRRTRSR